MSNFDVVRAWKDEAFRSQLTDEQRSLLPQNPAGEMNLSDEDMESVAGGGKFCEFTNPRDCFQSFIDCFPEF
jgi:mersacidin/lichenicidin family type 2 lantibiotic